MAPSCRGPLRRAWVTATAIGLLAGCTVPNPRLCKNDPACAASADLAMSWPADGPALADGPAPADGRAPPDTAAPDAAGGPCHADRDCGPPGGGRFCDIGGGRCQDCKLDDHCGADCRTCVGTVAPFCGQGGRECVQCRTDGDCAAGSFCDGRTCPLCNQADHCGPACSVCSGSAQPTCSGALRCSCTANAECGNDGDVCTNGQCQRSCGLVSSCATAPAGHRCVNFALGDDRCGCTGLGDCPAGSTACTDKRCVCGGTVCKNGQQCMGGACH